MVLQRLSGWIAPQRAFTSGGASPGGRPGLRGVLLVALSIAIVVGAAACERVEARSLVKEGNTLYKRGKLEQALASYERAAKLDSTFPLLHLHIGYACMGLSGSARGAAADRFRARATQAFSRYMKLAPRDERGGKFYLQTLLDAGRTDDALKFLRKQHEARPLDLKLIASLGMVASKANRFDEALQWYEKRAALQPGEAEPLYLIGTLCWERLYKNSRVNVADRRRIADRGIAALKKAAGIRARYVEALTYVNLLYRERALASVPGPERDRDLAQANTYHAQAQRLARAAEKKRTKPEGRR